MSAQTLTMRLVLGRDAALRPSEAAKLLPGVPEREAVQWMRDEGLVRARTIAGRRRELVWWGEVKDRWNDPDGGRRRRPPPLPRTKL